MKPTRLLTMFNFALLGMELSYLYLLASLLSGPIYILILILLIYPFAFLSRLALTRSAFPHRLRFTLEVASVTLVILLVAGERLLSSLPTGQADVFGIILRMGFCGLTWWLGHTVPHEEVNYSSISFRFQIGIFFLLIFAGVGTFLPVVLFCILAVIALAKARWETLSGSRGVLQPCSFWWIVLGSAVIFVPAALVFLAISPEIAGGILHWFTTGYSNFLRWFTDAMSSDFWQKPLIDINWQLPASCTAGITEEAPPLPPPPPLSKGTIGISPVITWLIVFAIFLAILALIAFALRRLKARRKARLIEPVRFQIRMISMDVLRSLISLFPQLLKRLWLWLTLLFQRWKRRPKPSEEPLISIRALYRSLLRWAARQGVARVPSQTPLEHLVLLEQGFPEQQDDLKQITEAYLLARYSQKPTSQEEFHRVKKAWQRAVAYHTPSRVRG